MYQELYKDRVSALRWAFLARRIVCISEIQGGTGFGFCLTAEAFRLHPSRVWWCLGYRVQERRGLELTLIAFLVRALISRTAFSTVGARLPAICREPAARPVYAECQASSSCLGLLLLRGRSRARWSAIPVAPTASGQNPKPRTLPSRPPSTLYCRSVACVWAASGRSAGNWQQNRCMRYVRHNRVD